MTKIKCKSLKSRIVMGSKKEGFVRTPVIAMIEMLHDAYVDGPVLARKGFAADRTACAHMFGLLMRGEPAGPDGLRAENEFQTRIRH